MKIGLENVSSNIKKGLPRFHVKSGQPLKRAVFAGKGRLRNLEAPGKS